MVEARLREIGKQMRWRVSLFISFISSMAEYGFENLESKWTLRGGSYSNQSNTP